MTAPLDRTKAPAVRPLPRLTLPRPERLVTPGGIPMTVLTSATCDAPVFQLRVTAGGMGSLDFPIGAAGTLYPQMLNQGSEGLDADALSEAFEGAGAWLGIRQHHHHLDISLRGLTESAGDVAAVLAAMLHAPLFPAGRLAVVAEKSAMMREVALRKPKVLADEATARMFWGEGHPAAYSAAAAELRAVTAADVAACHASFGAPRMHLYLSGNVTQALADTIALAFDRVYGDLCAPREAAVARWEAKEASPRGGTERITLPGNRQAAISMRIPAIGRSHPDYEMLRIAVTALGGYFGSRLNLELREERGLTYGISASLAGSVDGACMTVATECRGDAADEAVEAICSEIERFVAEPPEGDELRRLLGYVATTQAAILDSPFTIIDAAAIQQETIGTPPDYFDRMQTAIASATPGELARVAATHLASARSIAIVD